MISGKNIARTTSDAGQSAIISYDDLSRSDLIVDAIYEAKTGGSIEGEAISNLLPKTANAGGFRASGQGKDKKFVVLYTSGENSDWPDQLDFNTGRFVYYGDNRKPGKRLHDTSRKGNEILRYVFELLHSIPPNRKRIPPFFIFEKFPTSKSARSAQFRGLAVPGYSGLPATEDLVALWKTSKRKRYQNYRAIFTVLDIPIIKRAWLNDLAQGNLHTPNAPVAWIDWVNKGRYRALCSESDEKKIRDQSDQIPDSPIKKVILKTIWKHFREDPYAFEAFAARLFEMHDQRVSIQQITRGTVDGGRDAFGKYLLGLSEDPVYAKFSLEAKCNRPPLDGQIAVSVGVKAVSRLISRIRHREFGVLVTTSVIGRQAYEEVREDRHPIIFLCGKDIVDILTINGYNTPQLVQDMLQNDFPTQEKSHD